MNIQEDTSKARTTTSQRQQLSLFAKNFFKHPKMLGSIIPSSSFLVKRLLDQADWENARVLVEYGPGVGTISREILSRMHPEARLIMVETNEDFVTFLQDSIVDPRLEVVHGSAEDIKAILAEYNLEGADHVVAGIPFSTMPDALRLGVLKATQEALHPTGSLLLYQFSPKVYPDLQQIFSNVKKGFEPFNIPPAQVYFCTP